MSCSSGGLGRFKIGWGVGRLSVGCWGLRCHRFGGRKALARAYRLSAVVDAVLIISSDVRGARRHRVGHRGTNYQLSTCATGFEQAEGESTTSDTLLGTM